MADDLQSILDKVAAGQLSTSQAYTTLKGYEDFGYVKVDRFRETRLGFPEVIYGEGKEVEQIVGIFTALMQEHNVVLATRVDEAKGQAVIEQLPELTYFRQGKILQYQKQKKATTTTAIGILCAGTTDIPVAEEAAITAEAMGHTVRKFYDVGVAGIHRLFSVLDEVKKCAVLIVVAGMEGALPSVVGGLVKQPIIAVPTSIGYGANLAGVTPLLGMLSSCAPGITVVNINNGFGAAYSAALINELANQGGSER